MDNHLHKYKEFTKVSSNFSSNICRKMKLKMYSAGDIVTLTVISVWKYGTHCYEVTNCCTAGKKMKMFPSVFKTVYPIYLIQLGTQPAHHFLD